MSEMPVDSPHGSGGTETVSTESDTMLRRFTSQLATERAAALRELGEASTLNEELRAENERLRTQLEHISNRRVVRLTDRLARGLRRTGRG
ncbi:hypothetical protein EV379_0638 [Microterricola gilva]|uniref:Uncharacterized protein n=1 Tax=Microterricola gilva TaxID=393267 RepID=A0A4Q8AKA7_9MICO|nr:hypothetical protein [Microterricola gilva]RZU64343.1 hypothetical protein EV379_0638 [Microterricola gilva]